MAASPETQPSLLVKIRDEDDGESWSRFVEIYTPAIFGFLKLQGLQDADAADLTQDVMTSVAGAIKSFEYQPERGRFRGWLFTLVQNRLRNFWRGSEKRPVAKGDTQSYQRLLEHPDGATNAAEAWDREYEHGLYVAAAEQVRCKVSESTWIAFFSTVVDGKSTAQVAAQLNMSPAAVRLARARVIAKIKQEIQWIDGESS